MNKVGYVKINKNGSIIGTVKGHYMLKEIVIFKSIIKYLLGFSCGTTLIFCVLELCGYIGNF